MRLFLAALIGFSAAFALFIALSLVIEKPQSFSKRQSTPNLSDFIREKKRLDPKERQREKPKPPHLQPPTPQNLAINSDSITPPPPVAPVMEAPQFKLKNLSVDANLNAAQIASQSMEVIPLVRIAPRYPKQALRMRKGGFVTLEFTVREDGSVTEVRVIEAQPKGLFNRAAIAAIKQWKFKAKVINGVKVTQKGRQTINFKLKGSL